MDQKDPQNQQVLVVTSPTRIFRSLNAGRRIMALLHIVVGIRSMMMRKSTVNAAASYLEADKSR